MTGMIERFSCGEREGKDGVGEGGVWDVYGIV